METKEEAPIQGGCTCGAIRYSLKCPPLAVHSCHCRWCQRETGTAFALNAPIEYENITILTHAEPTHTHCPSSSGAGQDIARCPICKIALWSKYGLQHPRFRTLRVGTLDNPSVVGDPIAFLFMAHKVPWFKAPEGARVFEGDYEKKDVWSKSSLERLQAAISKDEEEWDEES